jgi:hypothetical protein
MRSPPVESTAKQLFNRLMLWLIGTSLVAFALERLFSGGHLSAAFYLLGWLIALVGFLVHAIFIVRRNRQQASPEEVVKDAF